MNRRKLQLGLLPVLTALFLLCSAPVSVQAGWIQDQFGWRYQEAEGGYPVSSWKEIDGAWYYFRDSGYIVTGPCKIDGIQYYFRDSGAMISGEWVEFREKWFYFQEDGLLARSSWIEDLYYVGKDGAMVTDKKVNGIYIDEDGVAEHPGDDFFD